MIRVIMVAGALAAGFAAAYFWPIKIARPMPTAGTALVLALDHSSSVDAKEWKTQIEGYARAFESEAVRAAILYGAGGGIVVMMYEWSAQGEQNVLVPWTTVFSEDDILLLTAKIRANVNRGNIGGTCTASAMHFAAEQFMALPVAAYRKVLDISSDEAGVCGQDSVPAARDALLALGVSINVLPILSVPVEGYKVTNDQLEKFYVDNVMGGPGAFSQPVEGYDNFDDAILMKIQTELSGDYHIPTGS